MEVFGSFLSSSLRTRPGRVRVYGLCDDVLFFFSWHIRTIHCVTVPPSSVCAANGTQITRETGPPTYIQARSGILPLNS